MTDVALSVVQGMLSVAALLTLVRIVRGPSVLDRVVASEALLSTIMLALLTQMVRTDTTTTLMAVLVMALLGFTAAVSVARFVSEREPEAEQ